MEPLIGILACGYMDDRQFIPKTYIEAIEKAGGIPVLLPCTAREANYPAYSRICNGFLFCGGDDVTPLLYGEELKTDKGTTDTWTDHFHLSFMRYALASKLPLLGICRGMQVLNIAKGGTIFQDISLRPSTSLNHMQHSSSRSDASHKITISSNSILYNILGDSTDVNSFHHQAIHTLAPDLKVTAIASDGIIEAIEDRSRDFVLGVQWHPECMLQSSPYMSRLFYALIEHAENSKKLQCILSSSDT